MVSNSPPEHNVPFFDDEDDEEGCCNPGEYMYGTVCVLIDVSYLIILYVLPVAPELLNLFLIQASLIVVKR